MGTGLATKVHDKLARSAAVGTGLIKDLTDSALMVEGVDRDIISDITTVLIREPLIAYTQAACDYHGIPVRKVDSGAIWQPATKTWKNGYVDLPVGPDHSKILLIPKIIVRIYPTFQSGEYYRHYLLTRLQDEHLKKNSGLVEVLRSGRRRVTKASLIDEYGQGKQAITEITNLYPDVLDKYRADKRANPADPLSHEDLADIEDVAKPDWDALLDTVLSIPRGNADATAYHRAAGDLLGALLFPSLSNMVREQEITQGRKRVDLVYTNTAKAGIFSHIASHYFAPHVFVECKNYTGDPKNPELDQLSGRFGNTRGQFGILLCREIADRALFDQRCRDTALDGRGYIVALDDEDLREMVRLRKETAILAPRPHESIIKNRFDGLVM